MDTPSLPDERPIMTVYPSIAALGLGRALGVLYESIPLSVGRVKLSHLLFPLPTAPFAGLLYFWLKAFGARYVLTTHRLRIVKGLSLKEGAEVLLEEIGRVDVHHSLGQTFFKAGTIVIRDHVGTERLQLPGVVRPDMFRQTILDARDAMISTEAARRTIEARHSQGAA